MIYLIDVKGELEGDYEIIGKYKERPQGEWKSEGYFVFCDYCGSSNGNNKTPFCPYCGAEMKEGEDHAVD